MKIFVVKNYEELSQMAADLVAKEMAAKDPIVLGLATGSTPEGMYEILARMYDQGKLDFSHVTSFNLDDYLGIDENNDQSYRYFMNKHLFSKVNIKKENTFVPPAMTKDPTQAGLDYDQKILDAGGIDLQILGIGINGHIGFNEPGPAFVGPTHGIKLTEETIKANSRFFESIDDVPREAITMGMKSILNARKIILVANGKNKADAIFKTVKGPITPEVPSSILQLHNDLTIIVDEEAASMLK
ncbi:glucosamine-6-phosphate deaminase [Neofamilia massiliensis]|uniref:glucosamine-6-phosphate deaminase n=1 Tax=Neofamilia massiliensis TaxID=1673724 RepID=UPI0006BB66FC|nr:glucosamine-6-phosphate deaminase [Neofamilia massiliensis]